MSSYRSPDAPAGLFGSLATTHIHIDGAPFDGTKRIVQWFDSYGIRGKVDQVLEWVAGPQRKQLPTIYSHHTAGEAEAEDFGCFSTMLLDDKPHRFHYAIQFLLNDAQQFPGVVLEVEEVFAQIDQRGVWQGEDSHFRWLSINPPHFGFFKPPQEASIEVHHAIDIEKMGGDERSPLSLQKMMEAKGDTHELGGLFRFDKEHAHAVRTNSFTYPYNIRNRIEAQYSDLNKYLDDVLEGRRYRLRTLVERVIGIKHI